MLNLPMANLLNKNSFELNYYVGLTYKKLSKFKDLNLIKIYLITDKSELKKRLIKRFPLQLFIILFSLLKKKDI